MPVLKNTIKQADGYYVRIWIAGDIEDARRICRKFCWNKGACVTVSATDYIYTGGSETGVVVGFINYPRFPKATDDILENARELANLLRDGLHQWAYTLETPDVTEWHSNRDD